MLSKQILQERLKEAQLKREELLVSTLRMLISVINNKELEKGIKLSKTEPEDKVVELSKLTEMEILETISSEVKKRRESVLAFEKGNRKELADKERKEIEFLEKYLPEQIPEEELKKIIQEVISKTGAKEAKDIGRVMAELMPKVKGKADGNLVSKIVKELLV